MSGVRSDQVGRPSRRWVLYSAVAVLAAAVIALPVVVIGAEPGASTPLTSAFPAARAEGCAPTPRDPGDADTLACSGVGGVTTYYHQLAAGTSLDVAHADPVIRGMTSVVSGCGVSYTGSAASGGPGGVTRVPVRVNVYPSAFFFRVSGPIGSPPTSLPVPTVDDSVVCPRP